MTAAAAGPSLPLPPPAADAASGGAQASCRSCRIKQTEAGTTAAVKPSAAANTALGGAQAYGRTKTTEAGLVLELDQTQCEVWYTLQAILNRSRLMKLRRVIRIFQ